MIAHPRWSVCRCKPQVKPLSRTETKQSEAGSRSYPPVEGFLLAASGHTQDVGGAKETGSAADFLPEGAFAVRSEGGCGRLPGVPPLGARDADRLRRGSGDAPRLMFVGEQPGDQEDRAGRPFVGPAGRLFDEALEEAGIDRAATYVTNAVKHFKWQAAGKRRIHQKPNWAEMTACRPWLEAELAVVRAAGARPARRDRRADAARPRVPGDAEPAASCSNRTSPRP